MDEVHPDIRRLMVEAIKTSPIDFTIIETVRSVRKQKENIKKGVSKTLKSRHIPEFNKSGLCEAIDIAPYPIDWQDLERFRALAAHIKRTAQKLNIPITWGGDWKTLIDMPHYELKT
jgi:peptidoglycan L-alanyl-D-glutamate endopeptidase CwlK